MSSFSKLQTCIQIKIYIKVKKKHFILIIQNNNKNRKHINFYKKKSFYKKLKPGDFTVAEGHGHPLVCCEICRVLLNSECHLIWIMSDKLFFHSLLEALACKFKPTFRNFYSLELF